MKVNYQYQSPSMCIQNGNNVTLGLSPDNSRDEKVSFLGKVKNPLVFRDAMLMLREIVISDASKKEKNRDEFFKWLDEETQRRIANHEEYLKDVENDLVEKSNAKLLEIKAQDDELAKLSKLRAALASEIDKKDSWRDYKKIERDFWKFIYGRDIDLWYVLDPVITVHPDIVSFEAFSVDESIYGCLSIDRDEFEMLKEPKLGTTNIDFSVKLATEMSRFRTYTDVELSVNPDGFTVDTGVMPEYIEKKIDLPESWVKGFTQVSSAANLSGMDIEISKVDMYDICSFLRRNKARKSPRYMKWIFEPNKPIKILFEPFKKELTLTTIYTGDKPKEEKIWGRRRWLVVEKLIPLVDSFTIKFLGFGMPQFVTGNLKGMKMTIGFSAWSANDWVKGTAFNVMSGFITDGNYSEVYDFLKEERKASFDEIKNKFSVAPKDKVTAGIGAVFKRGEGYFDPTKNIVRFRRLFNEPIPKEMYETTQIERDVAELIKSAMTNFSVKLGLANEFIFKNLYDNHETTVIIDEDGQITSVKCNCKTFVRGARNISEPCAHVLALYVTSVKFTKLSDLISDKEYFINDIMEVLL